MWTWCYNKGKLFYASLNSRTKKILLLSPLVIIALLYLWPSLKLPSRLGSSSPVGTSTSQLQTGEPTRVCVDVGLTKFRTSVDSLDAIINHVPLDSSEKFYVPYVGNGYVGLSMVDKRNIYIKYKSGLNIPLSFYPQVDVVVKKGSSFAGAYVLNIAEGLVHFVQCFKLDEEACLSVESIFYAHRARPSVIVQEIHVENPSDENVVINFTRVLDPINWKGATNRDARSSTSTKSPSAVRYNVTEGSLAVPNSASMLAVVVAYKVVTDSKTIKPNTKWTTTIITVVRYKLVAKDNLAGALRSLSSEAEQELVGLLKMQPESLRKEHIDIWTTLWRSGFCISPSLAPLAVNGDRINATEYYVMSALSAPLYEYTPQPVVSADDVVNGSSSREDVDAQRGLSDVERFEMEESLYFPDRCYDGHHTLQNTKLWMDMKNLEDLFTLVRLWLLTLENQGCATMLKAGADGALQAMLLSYGALKFNNHHLEFATVPADLHRDYLFRRINYGNDTHVNISVTVGADNRASLSVSLDKNFRPYYACDAGCLDEPLQLSRESVMLPVKLTQPVTPILYITADKQHMLILRDTIHVKEIAFAPAHEDHVMAEHRHGHAMGGLPVLFWAAIAILIVIFHLFLFKLIYNEYCRTNTSDIPHRDIPHRVFVRRV